MEAPVQTYETHRRYVPAFHFVAVGILAINVLWALVKVVLAFTRGASAFIIFDMFMVFAVAVALGLLAWYARTFSLTVQNRVIRLEERLRLERLCPDLKGRIHELRTGQLVALRFASDEELGALVRRVLDERITDQDVIKKAIRNWRADFLRA